MNHDYAFLSPSHLSSAAGILASGTLQSDLDVHENVTELNRLSILLNVFAIIPIRPVT